MSNELALLNENFNSVSVFKKGGSSDILEAIRDEYTSFEADTSTLKGRDEIKTKAYNVARSKTFLVEKAMSLKSEWKVKTDAVNAEVLEIKRYLDALKEEVRSPLNEWEAEDRRVKEEAEFKHKEEVRIEQERLQAIEDAKLKKEKELAIIAQQKIDKENEKIRLEQEERQRILDEQEAKSKATQHAIDENNRLEREAIEKEKAEIQAEKDKIAQAEIDRLAKVEADRLAENKRLEYIEQAEQKAINDERERVAEEKRYYEEKEAEIKRIDDELKKSLDHQILIKDEVFESLNFWITDGHLCQTVADEITKGAINHVTVNY